MCLVGGGQQGVVVVVVERQGGCRVVETRVHHGGRREDAGDHHSPVNTLHTNIAARNTVVLRLSKVGEDLLLSERLVTLLLSSVWRQAFYSCLPPHPPLRSFQG